MAKKTINSYGTATQMVGDINDNFAELYNGGIADHTDTYSTSEVLYSSGKTMSLSNGVLVFSDATTTRKIYCIDIDAADDSVAYKIPSIQSNNSVLGYAFVDDSNNIIASGTGGTTTADYNVLVSLSNVRKVYISKDSSSTGASVNVVVFGSDEQTPSADVLRTDFSDCLTYLPKKEISATVGERISTTSNDYVHVVVKLISGYKTIEGVGYSRSGLVNWAVLDKDLKVLKKDTYPSYYNTRTVFQHLPEGSRFLVYCESRATTLSNKITALYTLMAHLPKVEYNILALGNSFTQCYWTYVPAILNHLLGDDYKFTIFVGMLGASTFGGWKDWLTDGSSKSMSVSIDNKWKGYVDSTAQSLFGSNDFDLVCFQQQSNQSMTYSSWSGSWISAVKTVSQMSKKQIDFMWTMVHSKPEGSQDVSYTDGVMENIINAHKSMDEDFAVEICPVGTAIQNARHTSINDLVWAGDSNAGQLTPDGKHLQNGFACLIAGLVVARYIMKKLGIDIPCYGDKMNVDATFDATYSKLAVYGTSPVYSSGLDMNYLAQRCVEAALKFPFEIKTNLGTT